MLNASHYAIMAKKPRSAKVLGAGESEGPRTDRFLRRGRTATSITPEGGISGRLRLHPEVRQLSQPVAGRAVQPSVQMADSTIGHFELVEQIGLGTFGAVWRARHTELDRAHALLRTPTEGAHLDQKR